MKKLIVLSFLFSFAAHADIRLDGSKSIYEQLAAYFSSAEAVQPTVEDVIGWNAGRCYKRENPSAALGGMVVGEEVTITDNSNDGPLFPPAPPRKELRFIALGHPQVDHFDTYTKNLEDEITNYLSVEWSNVKSVEFVNDAIEAKYNGATWTLKKMDRYMLLKAFDPRGFDAYCYYFNKIRN